MDYIYTLDPTAETPVLVIDKHIGYDEYFGFGVDGSQFQREVMALDALGVKKMEVWINSPGGSVLAGYNIYNALIKCKANIHTYCYGMAASMAAIIFQAGKKRIIADVGSFMIHNPYGGDSDMLDTIRTGLVSAVASRSGRSAEDVGLMFDQETWFDAESCVSNGFADEVLNTGMVNRPKSAPTKDTVSNILKEYQLIFNKIKPAPEMDYTELKNALNLPEASKDAVVAKFEALNKEISDAKKALEDKVKELEELKKSNADKEAIEIVENGVKLGKIKAEAKDSFLALAKIDPVATKAAIDKLEVVKASAPVPVIPDTTVKNGIPADRKDWTIRDWEKNDPKGLGAIRNSNPELYDQMFNDFYKKGL